MNEFPIAPATSRYLWFLIPVFAVLVAALVLIVVSVRGSRFARFEVRSDALALHGDLYGRVIPKTQLRLELARRVNLVVETALRPQSRRMGTALPGYQAGWFRLANGEKALVYLTDRTKAVYIPTTVNYSLLLSPLDPDAFLARLRGLRS